MGIPVRGVGELPYPSPSALSCFPAVAVRLLFGSQLRSSCYIAFTAGSCFSMSWNIPIPSGDQGIAIPGRDGEILDPRSLSTTPGGTIFGTTPGGTRIVYDRAALMALASSPLRKPLRLAWPTSLALPLALPIL